jgi:hypothetical protein
MEPSGSRRPDLFDIKYLRDELLYYSRDENQFLRHRHVFGFLLTASLREARFKDPALPAQRIIMALALVVAAIELLTEWLSDDALRFDLIFEVGESDDPLAQERGLLQTVLQDAIAKGAVQIKTATNRSAVIRDYAALAERVQCRLLTLQTSDSPAPESAPFADRLSVSGPCPRLTLAGERDSEETSDPEESWKTALGILVSAWL